MVIVVKILISLNMMKMKRYIIPFLVALVTSFLMVACGDSYMGIEQVKTDSTKPGKITVNEVISGSGTLEIHFSLPKGNPNIAQVVATYINKGGNEMEFSVSRYSSFILVEGFTGTNEVTVELKCVDSSGNESEITYVKAAPLKSPVEIARETMEVVPAFGGLKVEWQNSTAKPFAIHVLTEDLLQQGVVSFVEDPTKTIYTSDSINTYSYVRQYPSVEQKFGFVLSDKWGNRTDTLVSFLIPYKEEEIDFNLVKNVPFFNPTYFNGRRDYAIYGESPTTGLQNDANAHAAGFSPKTMFDGVRSGAQCLVYKFVKNLPDKDPANHIIVQDAYMTFDLNMSVRLSRVQIYPRNFLGYTYNRSSPRHFKIWGTNDDNKDRWSKFPGDWTLIGEYIGKDPADINNLTAEEIEWFNLNQEFAISEDNLNPDASPTEAFRYMRLQLIESYNKNESFYTINEFQMFGDIQEYY